MKDRGARTRWEAAYRDTVATLSSRPYIVGLALFVVACCTRLLLIGTARFLGDEIEQWEMATRIVKGEEYPLLGREITTMAHSPHLPGPIFFYLMALPLFISRAPEACNAMVAVLGATATVIYWSALRPYFGLLGATFAAFFMACMPWSSLYADRIWNPNAVVIFVAIAFYAACRVRRKPSFGGVVLLFVSAAAIPQFHLSAPVVWIPLIPIAWPSIRKWRWYWPLVGVVCAAALYVPMVVSEVRHHWENTRYLLHDTAEKTLDYRRVPLWAFRLLTLDISYHEIPAYWGGAHTEKEMLRFALHGSPDFRFNFARRLVLGLSAGFAALAVIVATLDAWRMARHGRPRPFYWAALLALITNTALLGLSHKAIYGHYIHLPLPFYFVAFAAIGRDARRWNVTNKALTFGMAAAICVGGIDAATWESRTLDARNGLRTMRQVIAAIRSDAPGVAEVNIKFPTRVADRGYRVVAGFDKDHPLKLGKDGPHYELLLARRHAPAGARLVKKCGPLTLYRLPDA
jgi:hypothetical protein